MHNIWLHDGQSQYIFHNKIYSDLVAISTPSPLLKIQCVISDDETEIIVKLYMALFLTNSLTTYFICQVLKILHPIQAKALYYQGSSESKFHLALDIGGGKMAKKLS